MNIQYSICPICQKETIENNVAIYCISDGKMHYHYSKIHNVANIHIANDINVIYNSPYGISTTVTMPKINSKGWEEIFSVNTHLELDLSNLEKSIQRVRNLIIFS
jgi:hypothetical protein